MPSRAKAKQKSNHGGRREGAGRKPANALRCPTCTFLSEQLQLAHDREQKLIRQIGEQSRQIGQVIENRFETVRVAHKDLPQADKSAMPIEQLQDIPDDQEFVSTVAGLTH